MYIDSVNIRQMVPNCLQLTPTVALSVVSTIFRYSTVQYISVTFPNEIQHAVAQIFVSLVCVI